MEIVGLTRAKGGSVSRQRRAPPEVAERFLAQPPAPLHPSVVSEVRNVIRTGRKSGRLE
jgi:hypothetical protein